MAVPSSGSLSMLGIRRELGTNNYSSTTTYSNISLQTMSNGGNGTINTANASSDRPDGSAPHSMAEFYAYDHDKTSNQSSNQFAMSFTSLYNACHNADASGLTYYWSGSSGSNPVTDGLAIYTNSLMTNPVGPAYIYYDGYSRYWNGSPSLTWSGSAYDCEPV
tara:strand:- start:382 stop:870 length:489 start_codon:yes stop_codon:yes gene_type:complete